MDDPDLPVTNGDKETACPKVPFHHLSKLIRLREAALGHVIKNRKGLASRPGNLVGPRRGLLAFRTATVALMVVTIAITIVGVDSRGAFNM